MKEHENRFTVVSKQTSLFLCHYVLMIVLISIQTTVTLPLAHPVQSQRRAASRKGHLRAGHSHLKVALRVHTATSSPQPRGGMAAFPGCPWE